MFKIISKNEEWKRRFSKGVCDLLYRAWGEIEADWERIDTGFTICADLAKLYPDFSKQIFTESENLKKGSWIDSQPVAFTFIYSLKIILKAYTGLLLAKSETKEDYKIIEELIGRIPSDVEKAKLWTELGLHSYITKREDIARSITDNHVIFLIQGLLSKNISSIRSLLDSITLIHLFNSDLAMEFIGKIPKDFRESVLCRISDFYISKKNPFEEYDKELSKYNSSYSDLVKAVSIISLLETDNYIYYQIREINKAILSNKSALNKTQVSEIISKLSDTCKKRLPDVNNIKHQGFVILSDVALFNAKKESNNSNNSFWTDIIEKANNIPNASDKIFVKATLLDETPFDKIKNGSEVRSKIYNEIVETINSLQSHYEFVQRVIDISDTMYNIDRNKWKEVVNKAFSVSNTLDDGSDSYKSQKSIIDSMYRIDSSYAKELIKLVDKNKTEDYGKYLHEHFETLEIASKIKDNKELDQKQKENYRQVVWGVISALRSLNSDKLTAKKISEITEYIAIGNKLPLHEVFPVFIYYLRNCSGTYRADKLQGAVFDIHRENFREAVKSTNLIELLSHRRKVAEKSYKKFFIDEDFSTNKVTKPHSREDAFQFIKNWLIDQAEEFLIIADPYFQKEDLDILKLVKETGKDLEIDILGSTNGSKANVDIEFQSYWKHISVESAPFTNITFCWVPGQSVQVPFHDRWILTKNSGMRLGTSINSMGKNKDSELSVMKPTESLRIKEEILYDYINKKKREFNTLKLSYKSFNL